MAKPRMLGYIKGKKASAPDRWQKKQFDPKKRKPKTNCTKECMVDCLLKNMIDDGR